MEIPTRDVGPGERESFSSIQRWCAPRESQDSPIVLEPEHPHMQKFQAVLKKYLEKENDCLNTEILELRANLKNNRRAYEAELAQEVFTLEQDVSKQRKEINRYEDDLKGSVKSRMAQEEIVNKSEETYKERVEKLNETKRKDGELLGELEALNMLCKQYEAWQAETDSELAVNQRISEKMADEKNRLAQEKKDLDMMVFNLTTEVWKLESQITLLEDQTQIKVQELETIGTIVSDGTVDLQALDSEHRQLMQIWGSVVVSIQQRDKICTSVNDEYQKVQVDLQTLLTSIEVIKKEIAEEMKHNESLTVLKEQLVYELKRSARLVQIEENKQTNLDIAISQVTTSIQLIEKDLHFAKMENANQARFLKRATRELEKLTEEKIQLEIETLNQLQERLTTDKAAEGMAAKIRQLKDESQKLEINMLNIENQQAKALLEIEKLKTKNARFDEIVLEDKKNCALKQAEIKESERQLKEVVMDGYRKQNYMDTVMKKIVALVTKLEGREIDPVQRKIEELEREIGESTKQSKQMQQDWLRMQSQMVLLSNQYQERYTDINVIRRQIRIMEHKILKLEIEKNRLMHDEKMVQRSLDELQSQVDQIYKRKFEDQVNNQEMEEENKNLTVECMVQLKEAELEAMNIEEEITELENDKEQLADDIHKIRKEIMSWEKKEIMAAETKEKIDEVKCSTGEIGRMKLEIHRMQVRYAEVSRTAERLGTDLAQLVGKREAAAARARPRAAPELTRQALTKKLKDKRDDVKRVHQEIEMNKNMITIVTKEQNVLQQEIDRMETAISETANDINSFERQMQMAELKELQIFERIIIYQRYDKYCTSVASERTRPHSVKFEPMFVMEFYQQKKLITQLQVFIKELMNDLPDKKMVLTKMLDMLITEDEEYK